MNLSLPCPGLRPQPSPFDALRRSMTAMLTTYRRNGQPVSTLVEIQVRGDKAYFYTWSTTAKVKRLLHTPRAELAPTTLTGKVSGAAIQGLARRLEGAEAAQAARRLKGQWLRWVWKWIYRLYYQAEPVLYEVSALDT
jgi:PPOX class probable F420-dependent enzyme